MARWFLEEDDGEAESAKSEMIVASSVLSDLTPHCTDEATIISLFADSASPSSSSRNHLTAISWTDDAIVY